jgi:hypothetical protein
VTSPYNLEVVLHFADHRFLTKAFREDVRRQLEDLLRLNFGRLARVQVKVPDPRKDALLRDILTRGLGPALDAYEDLSDVKKHFVLIDYVGGRYRVRARQHDGLTGLNSPVVRREETGDRRAVPRLAARLVDRDFGLVGTVTGRDQGGVRLALRGGRLVKAGVLRRWIDRDDILAVSRLSEEGGKARAARLEWALLQVEAPPAGGACRCRYYHRYTADDLDEGPGTQGYRGLRLTATTAPLRLRLLDDQTLEPRDGLTVKVSHTGFGVAAAELTSTADGLVTSNDSYAGVAFVQVFAGTKPVAQMPVEVVADGTVVCRVRVNQEAGDITQLELRRERWLRRLFEELRFANDRVKKLNALLGGKRPQPEVALGEAELGRKNLAQEIKALKAEREALRKAAKGVEGFDLAEGDQPLRDLDEQQNQLGKFIDNLHKAIAEAEAEQRLRIMLQRAVLLEKQADFPAAIKQYKEVLTQRPKEAKVRAYLGNLEKEWALHGPEHEKARAFIYDQWPRKMDTAALKAALPKAWEAFKECQKVGDRLSPRKMLAADVAHAGELKDRLAALRRAPDREDRRTETKTIVHLAAELQRLHAEVSAFVRPEARAAKGKE